MKNSELDKAWAEVREYVRDASNVTSLLSCLVRMRHYSANNFARVMSTSGFSATEIHGEETWHKVGARLYSDARPLIVVAPKKSLDGKKVIGYENVKVFDVSETTFKGKGEQGLPEQQRLRVLAQPFRGHLFYGDKFSVSVNLGRIVIPRNASLQKRCYYIIRGGILLQTMAKKKGSFFRTLSRTQLSDDDIYAMSAIACVLLGHYIGYLRWNLSEEKVKKIQSNPSLFLSGGRALAKPFMDVMDGYCLDHRIPFIR